MSYARLQEKITRRRQRQADTAVYSPRAMRRRKRLWSAFVLSSIALVVLGALDLYQMAKTPPLRATLPAFPPIQKSGPVGVHGPMTLESIGKPLNRERRVFWGYHGALLLNPVESTTIDEWEWDGPMAGEKRKTLPHRVTWRIGGQPRPAFRFDIAAATGSKIAIERESWPNTTHGLYKPAIHTRVSADALFPPGSKYGALLVGVAREEEAITFAQVPMPGRFDTSFGASRFAVSEQLSHSRRAWEGNLTLALTLPDLPKDPETGVPRYAWKVYAVDYWGNAHAADGMSTSNNDKDTEVYWVKRSAASVRHIRLAIAPYYWVSWQNIPLDCRGARAKPAPTFPVPTGPFYFGGAMSRRTPLLLKADVRNMPPIQVAEITPGKINVAGGMVGGGREIAQDASFTTYVPRELLNLPEGILSASVQTKDGRVLSSARSSRSTEHDRKGLACVGWRFAGVRQDEAELFVLELTQE